MTRRREQREQPLRAIDLGGRVPPHNAEAEAAVLSAILCNASALDIVLAILTPEHFYSDANRRIFEAAKALHAVGTPVDVSTVAAWLNDRDRIRAIGGVAYLATIVDATPAVAHVAAHAKIVKEKARIRKFAEACQLAAAAAYGDYGNADEFIGSHAQAVADIAQEERASEATLLYDVVRDNVARMLRAREQGAVEGGYSTGIAPLDAQTGGLHPAELLTIAARPGHGKSGLALTIADHLGAHPGDRENTDEPLRWDGYAVHLFSLEMPKEQQAERLTCAHARIALNVPRDRPLTDDESSSYLEAANNVAQRSIWIYDASSTNLVAIRAHVRAAMQKMPRRRHVVMVDYLQLTGGDGEADNREQEIARLTRGLKVMAVGMKIPVVVLSQLNRKVEERADKRPMLSDLRESGAIEQDSDAIWFIFRPEEYDPQPWNAGLAKVDVAKQRSGPKGEVDVAFRGFIARFETPSDTDRQRWSTQPAGGGVRTSRRSRWDPDRFGGGAS